MDVNDDDDHQELEALETLSLADFPLTKDGDSVDQNHDNHSNPPSSATDLFKFCSGGSSKEHMMMSHAEDMISGGKLIPINDQPNHEQPPRTQNQNPNKKHIQHARCESMRHLKSTTGTASQLFRNSFSLDYKKLNRNSKLNCESSTPDMNCNSLSNRSSSSSSRWSDLMFGPLKVPREMDLRDIRNRQIVQNTSKSLFPTVEACDRFPAVRRGAGEYHRKTSWGVLGLLSCKRSGSVAVTTPLS